MVPEMTVVPKEAAAAEMEERVHDYSHLPVRTSVGAEAEGSHAE